MPAENSMRKMTHKFRVWYKDTMLYPDQDEARPDDQWFMGQDGQVYRLVSLGVHPVKGAEAMPAMGWTVKDKDGSDHELYDGDILDWNIYSGARALHLVGYDRNESAWCLYMHPGRLKLGFQDAAVASWIRVAMACKGWPGPDSVKPVLVGNRWENPELMGQCHG